MLRYGIKWASLSQHQVETAMAPVWKAYKAVITTPVSTSTAALKAFGFGDFWHELNTDRLITFIRLLSGKDEHSRRAIQSMLHIEQRWYGGGTFFLQAPYNEHRGWSGTLMNRVWKWMDEHNITLKGGKGVDTLREDDVILVDAVGTQDEKARMAKACWAAQAWRLSEILRDDNTVTWAWSAGQCSYKLVVEACGTEGFREWRDKVMQIAGDWKTQGRRFGKWKRSAVRMGAMCIWKDGTEWVMGTVLRALSENSWEDLVEVRPLTAVRENTEKLRLTDPLMQAWPEWVQQQIPRHWVDREAQSETIGASQLFLVHAVSKTVKTQGSVETVWGIDETSQHIAGRLPAPSG